MRTLRWVLPPLLVPSLRLRSGHQKLPPSPEGGNLYGVPFPLVLVLLAACAGPQRTGGPELAPADVTARPAVELARFRDARALATDGARLYVADAGASVVVVLTPEGLVLQTLGGPGSGDYGFLEPSGIDPTNGLELYVTDAGNARIQRFSHDGRLLETIPVPAGESRVVGRPDRGRSPEDEAVAGLRGRPVAVAVGPANARYAVEVERGVVLQWEGRRLARLLGADGAGALAEPADVAVTSDGTVFVADQAQGAVLVYGPLGEFRRAVPGDAAGGVRAVGFGPSPLGERLLVVGPRAVAVHRPEGGLDDIVLPRLGEEELVDAAMAAGHLFVLTPTRLLRVE
jgi:hypothetical protein